jgi:hypothetical protein
MPSKIKQVRFAYQNLVYPAPIPVPMPPGLSRSVSTVPSSSGPITPPDVRHPLPAHYALPKHAYPHHGIPKAPSSTPRYLGPASVAIHPYLATDGVVWDLMDPPSAIIRNRHSVSSRTLSEPATQPTLPFISIVNPRLPWSFKIHASNARYVTLGDVLDTLFRTLRINLAQPDFQSLSDKDRRRATRAYEDRYRRLRSSRMHEEEKRGGMKRVDFLLGHTRFVGLTNDGRPDQWHLRVS